MRLLKKYSGTDRRVSAKRSTSVDSHASARHSAGTEGRAGARHSAGTEGRAGDGLTSAFDVAFAALGAFATSSVALAAFLGSPLYALAEEVAEEVQETPSAFDILIPKPAEFIPALIAFVVIWAVLAKFVWPSVLKTLDKRQQTIQDNLDAAEENKLETARAYKKAQDTVEDAQAQAEDIITEARRDAESTRETIIKKANADAERINNKALDNIQAEKNAAMVGLQDQMADLAVDLAGEIIGEHLDAKTQKKLIEESLKEATTPEGFSKAKGAANKKPGGTSAHTDAGTHTTASAHTDASTHATASARTDAKSDVATGADADAAAKNTTAGGAHGSN